MPSLQFWSKAGVLWAAGVGWDEEESLGKGAKCLGTFRFLWVLYEIRPSIQREGQSQRTELTLFVFLAGCGWKWQGPSWYIVHLQFQENHPWAKLVGFHHWTNHIQLSLLCFQSFTLDFKLTWGQMYHTDTRLLRRLLVPSSRCALFCFIPMCFIDPSYLQLLYIQAGCLLSWMFSDGTGQQAGPRTSSRTCS